MSERLGPPALAKRNEFTFDAVLVANEHRTVNHSNLKIDEQHHRGLPSNEARVLREGVDPPRRRAWTIE